MAGELPKPHDHLFRSVFGEEGQAEAAGLLQEHLPEAISRELRWSSLKWQSTSFIDERLRDSESDLLYAIERKADGAPAWLYVLLEHQSTPDAWLRLRLLKYSIRIWERDRRRHPNEEQLRPIVPLVWYQGERGWRHGRERLVPMLAELAQETGIEDVRQIVVYLAATTRERARWDRFAEAVRRQVPGGGELMNKADEMVEIYGEVREREGRQEGRREGQLGTIEKLVQAGVAWTTIEAATGIDERTFDRLKHQLDAADDGDSAAQ